MLQHKVSPTAESSLTMDQFQAQKYHLANTYSDYSSILTYDETGYSNYSNLIDEYSDAYDTAAAKAGRFLVQNLQDETMRAGLSLAGWNPRHSDMKKQAAEWWNWGE